MEYAVKCVLGIELKTAPDPSDSAADDGLKGHVEETMGELAHRWISASTVVVDTSRSEATFTVVVDAGDQDRAMSKAWGVLSMAVHAAGGATSHRPFPRDATWSVRLLRAKASPRATEDKTPAYA
jgi:hypothetical protein